MTRLPLIPTLLVGLAVATMIVLGFWQLDRRSEKREALARFHANLSLPAIGYPTDSPSDPRFLFRTLSADCRTVTDWEVVGGRMPDGSPGWRHIASCTTAAGGAGLRVDMGTSADSAVRPQWTGGEVKGIASWEPGGGSALLRLMREETPRRLMIIADTPAAGLAPSSRPDPASIPNNHLAYAVQWFLFAGVALVIYGLALRPRNADRGT